MFVIVSYDIPNDKRRTQVMKTLKDYGAHVQYSVFECELKPELYRRLHYDLLGLPPNPANVEFFAANPTPQAYSKAIDRLLESPQYGESGV